MVYRLHQIDGMFVCIVYIYNSIQHNGDISPESVWQTLLDAAALSCWRYNCWSKIQAFHLAQLFVSQMLLLHNKRGWLFSHVSMNKIPHFFSILMRYGHFHPTAFFIIFRSFSAVLEFLVPLRYFYSTYILWHVCQTELCTFLLHYFLISHKIYC